MTLPSGHAGDAAVMSAAPELMTSPSAPDGSGKYLRKVSTRKRALVPTPAWLPCTPPRSVATAPFGDMARILEFPSSET
jgi:hypothetical protein